MSSVYIICGHDFHEMREHFRRSNNLLTLYQIIKKTKGNRTKHPATKYLMPFFVNPDRITTPDKTSNAVFVTQTCQTSHAISVIPDKASHAIFATLDKASHFLGYFLAKTARTNHPTFLVSFNRVHYEIHIN